MRLSERFEMIDPEAARLAGAAIDAARARDHAAAIRCNQQLVAFHQARTACQRVKARAARTLEHLGAQLRTLPPPPPAPASPGPREHYDHGELKRKVVEALLRDDRPLSAAELAARVRVDQNRLRKVLSRLVDAGIAARRPAREVRPDLGAVTRWCWTTVDRVGDSAG